MEQILTARNASVKFYKKYETFILPVLRFILGFYVFSLIGSIGHSMEALEVITDPSMQIPYAMLMGLLFTILPISMGYFLMAFNIIIQFSASLEVAVMVAAALLLVLFFYGRLGGTERWLLLFMLLGFYFRIPYIVPLIAGLYFGIQSIFPIIISIFLWEFYPLAFNLMHVERARADTIIDIPDSFGQVFAYCMDAIAANDAWIAVAFVFALVTLVVHVASKMDVDFSKEIAIGMGVVINIVSFIFLTLAIGLDVNIVTMILLSVLSGLIVLFIKLFDLVLNYQRAERVEFEDDDNYYFVRVIPKMTIAKKERTIKKVREGRKTVHTEKTSFEYDDYLYGKNEKLDDTNNYGDYYEEKEEDDDYYDKYEGALYDELEDEDRNR